MLEEGDLLLLYLLPPLDNRALPINRKQKVFPNGTLIIENVERNSDQASYTCVAKNTEGFIARGAIEIEVMGKLTICWGKSFYYQFSGRRHLRTYRRDQSVNRDDHGIGESSND